eukprot:TRINITY_DN29569_c0_g1_i2.p1 TRINITY_DN29569_c0_g1~~TRINITY_DN29569_c0_g1_i2.p1  ORF type:complete len:549 (-),score=64.71 TRINITY_DN29569_c0_g1_i2:35-1681(-)
MSGALVASSIPGTSTAPSLHELQKASLAARALRNSLHRLVTQLATQSSQLDGQVPLEQLREEVAASFALNGNSLLENETAGISMAGSAAPGIPPRLLRKRSATSDADSNLIPRLRLRVCDAVTPGSASSSSVPEQASGLQRSSEVVAVAVYSRLHADDNAECSGMATLLSCGRLEVWERDLFSWHRTSSLKIRLPEHPNAHIAFSRGGRQLWAVYTGPTDASSPVSTRLYLRSLSGAFRLSAVVQGPCASVLAGPIPLPGSSSSQGSSEITGAALALVTPPETAKQVHVLQWCPLGEEKRGHLQPAAVFSLDLSCRTTRHLPSEEASLIGLWALPNNSEESLQVEEPSPVRVWCMAACLGLQNQPIELQLLTGLGECLAVLSLSASVSCLIVPPQKPCPPEALRRCGLDITSGHRACSPFLLLLGQQTAETCNGEWVLAAVVAAEPEARACVKTTASSKPLQCHLQKISSVDATGNLTGATAESNSEGLVAFRGSMGSRILDWQQQRVHVVPRGWSTVAVGSSTVILSRGGYGEECAHLEELVFFELS